MQPDELGLPHLEAGDVAAYLDRALAPADRVRVETHLAECEVCRGELLEVRRVLRAPARKWRWAAVAGVAAAAAAVLLVVWQPEEPGQERAVLRGGESTATEGVATLAAVAPRGPAPVARDSVVFTWRRLGEGVHYRLTLTDERGDVLWTHPTSDTTVNLPRAIALRSAQTYFWYVDALLPDGRSATTGVTQFRVAR